MVEKREREKREREKREVQVLEVRFAGVRRAALWVLEAPKVPDSRGGGLNGAACSRYG